MLHQNDFGARVFGLGNLHFWTVKQCCIKTILEHVSLVCGIFIFDCQAMLHQNNFHKIEDDILIDNSDFNCPDLRRDLEGSENWKTESRRSTINETEDIHCVVL
jgi:hypothetical protein